MRSSEEKSAPFRQLFWLSKALKERIILKECSFKKEKSLQLELQQEKKTLSLLHQTVCNADGQFV
ncbi:hypothetical protein Tcan_03959 [Toxocara canis]|uniref:Uncharacterized protein n=1 Tax=Toxocara canis TaxID=6265 RepID=A0A0B2UMG7_TOXCA|nr:hypothetical protein Tcan_03959 [Toxocara canis]